MGSTKEIQTRMKSIQDTMKITNAMYMISSSKMQKAKRILSDTEPYYYNMQAAISRILRHMPDTEHPFFSIRHKIAEEDRKIGCIVVTEGVAFGLRDSLEVARSLGIKIERTKICGGGAKSPLWKKIIANVMNLKVDVLENEEGPSMGGAMLAAVGCGAYPDVETIGKKFAKVVDTVEPDPELVAKYEERYQKFRTLYPAMKPLF